MLTLGGIAFDGYSTPSSFPLGGKQGMAVHKLPGGSRVIDTLGPDEADIHWSGFFFSNDAEQRALIVDAMRASGQVVPLTVEDQFRSVIVYDFTYRFRRYPVWIEYEITCVVASNPGWGSLIPSITGVGSLISADVGSAGAVIDSGPAAAGTGNTGGASPPGTLG